MKEAKIRVRNWMMTISDGEDKPLPESVVKALTGPLTYDSVSYNPVKVWNPDTGRREKQTKITTHRMWGKDAENRLVCEYGAFPVLMGILEELGYSVRIFRAKSEVVTPGTGVLTLDWDAVERRFDFRPRQKEALTEILKHEGGIIDAVTAFGKAYVIAMVCAARPKARILVTTKSIYVAEGLGEVISKYLSGVKVYHSRSKSTPDSRIVVCTSGSLDNIEAAFDILLVDEVHELVTDHFAKKLSRFRNCQRFGFTASKETRGDNHHHRMLPMFGPTIFKITFPQAVELGLTVPINVMWLHPEGLKWDYDPTPGTDCSDIERARYCVWRHEARNQLFADAARSLVDSGKQTLLSCATLEHALHLKKLLPDFTLVYSPGDLSSTQKKKMRSLDLPVDDLPTLTDKLMREYKERFKHRDLMNVIMTPVWSVGVSFDSLEVVGRCDGTSSETSGIQLPGRVCRTHEESGKEVGILLDCWDSFSKNGSTRAMKKSRFYRSLGWDQTSFSTGKPWAEYLGGLAEETVSHHLARRRIKT